MTEEEEGNFGHTTIYGEDGKPITRLNEVFDTRKEKEDGERKENIQR